MAAIKPIEDLIECPICTETFRNTRVLPCIHTFCLHCISEYGKNKKPGDVMRCPCCRKEFTVPRGGLAELPKNILIEKLLEVHRRLPITSVKKYCSTKCHSQMGENQPFAKWRCVECEQHLCGDCRLAHVRNKGIGSHRVLSYQQEDYCTTHPDTQLDIFCTTCKIPVCFKCSASGHKGHQCTNLLDYTRMKERENEELGLCINVLLEDQMRMRENHAGANPSLQSIVCPFGLHPVDGFVLHCLQCRKIFFNNLAFTENSVIQTLEERMRKVKYPVLLALVSIAIILACVIAGVFMTGSFNSWGSSTSDGGKVTTLDQPMQDDYCITSPEKNERIFSLIETLKRERVECSAKLEQYEKFKETPSPKLEQMVETLERERTDCSIELKHCKASKESQVLKFEKVIGTLKREISDWSSDLKECKTSKETLNPTLENIGAAQVSQSDNLEFKPNPRTTFHLMPDDGRAVVAIALMDDQLLIANSRNHKLDAYEPQSLRYLGILSNEITDIAGAAYCPNDNSAYISTWNRMIYRMDSSGEILAEWFVGQVSGFISVTDSCNVILALYDNSRKIRIYSSDGKHIKSVGMNKDIGESRLLKAAEKADGNFVVSYGSGRGAHGIDIVNSKGFSLKTYGGMKGKGAEQLNSPFDFIIVESGNIIVADCGNHRVLLLSPNLEFIREIFSRANGLRYPFRIQLNRLSNKIYVAENDWNSVERKWRDGKITVFDKK